MYGDMVPNAFEIPESTAHKPRRWLMPLVMTAIVIGATVALVAINKAPPSAEVHSSAQAR